MAHKTIRSEYVGKEWTNFTFINAGYLSYSSNSELQDPSPMFRLQVDEPIDTDIGAVIGRNDIISVEAGQSVWVKAGVRKALISQVEEV